MFETNELSLGLEYKSISESVTPAKTIAFDTNLLNFKTSQKKIAELDLGESEDLTCFFIRSIKSKTQVSSPTIANFLNKPSPKFINKEEIDKVLKSSRPKVVQKDVKPNKVLGKMKSEPGTLKNKEKFLNKNQEKTGKILSLLEGLKCDHEDLKEFFNGFSDFKRILQDSLTVVMKQLSENRQGSSRNNCSIGSDSDIKVFSLKNESFKGQVYKKFEEIQEAFLRKMKNGALAFNQTVAELKEEIRQKNEKIQRVLSDWTEAKKVNKRLEETISELNCQLDRQIKENSELMQKYLKTFKELSDVKRSKAEIRVVEVSQPGSEKLMNENKELKGNVSELERVIKDLTKGSGISQIQQENNKLQDQVRGLTVKLSHELRKSEKLEGLVKDLEKNLQMLDEKKNWRTGKIENSKNIEFDLRTHYPKLNRVLSLPMCSESFESFLPKIQKLENFLESILNFRINKHKTFTFPATIIDYQQVPTKFIEKNLSYLKFLINASNYFLARSLNFQSSDKFIKELEYLIYSIKEKHFEDTERMREEFKKQEDLYENEILFLQKEVLMYKARIGERKKTPIKRVLSQINVADGIGNDGFVVERGDISFVTPSKNRVQDELEYRVRELGESVKKYKEKNQKLKSSNDELASELRDLQFSKKIV